MHKNVFLWPFCQEQINVIVIEWFSIFLLVICLCTSHHNTILEVGSASYLSFSWGCMEIEYFSARWLFGY